MSDNQEKDLEPRVQQLEIRMALAENNIQKIETKLDKIDANLSKLMWIVLTAVVLAIVNMVLKGGV